MEKKTIIDFLSKNFFLLILIILFSYLFLYHLDFNTLVSWDEGWYASITREIVRRGDIMKMYWKDLPYYDHPPMGFWLMAISYKIFGINEFSTRFPSALLGLLTIIIIYKTAIELFGKKIIGFVASLVLGTSVWYLIRVRSGNLESTFVFFYIMTIYLSVKSSKNFKWFPTAMAAFGSLILSKTLVGILALIPIIFINLNQLIKIKKNFLYLALGIIVFVLMVYPWYYIHLKTYPLFFEQHFISIGTRSKTLGSFLRLNPSLPLFYLHMGVRKWYYIWIVAALSIIFTFNFLKKPFFFLFIWNLIILYPFLTTEKTHIWHLIPVYLPMCLIIAVGIYYLKDEAITILKKINFLRKIKFIKIITKPIITNSLYFLFFIILALIQIKIFYKEVIPNSRYIPDDVDISKKVAKYNKKIFLDDDFLPIAVFYSGKDITPVIDLPDEKRTMARFFKSDEKDFVMITRSWAIDNLVVEKIPYKILEKNNSFSIVTRP